MSATPTASASVDPDAAAEAGPADAFRSYDRAYRRAVASRNSRVADLIELTTPRQQADDRGWIQTMHQRGIIFKGTLRNWVGPVSVSGNRATLEICEKDDAGRYVYAASGKIVVPVKDRWNGYEVRALRRDGQWQIDSLTSSKKVSCKGAE